MAIRNQAVFSESPLSKQQPPIQYVTENGFSIIRLSEMKPSFTDTAQECCFVVRNPRGWEREVTIEFETDVIALIESCRRSPLLASSPFWLNCAERCLAKYLWHHDAYPPAGQLTISELCIDELLLAAHWRD